MTLYPDVSPIELDQRGGYYARHISAMTSEGLHAKHHIAEQLGLRDMLLDDLTDAIAALLTYQSDRSALSVAVHGPASETICEALLRRQSELTLPRDRELHDRLLDVVERLRNGWSRS